MTRRYKLERAVIQVPQHQEEHAIRGAAEVKGMDKGMDTLKRTRPAEDGAIQALSEHEEQYAYQDLLIMLLLPEVKPFAYYPCSA